MSQNIIDIALNSSTSARVSGNNAGKALSNNTQLNALASANASVDQKLLQLNSSAEEISELDKKEVDPKAKGSYARFKELIEKQKENLSELKRKIGEKIEELKQQVSKVMEIKTKNLQQQIKTAQSGSKAILSGTDLLSMSIPDIENSPFNLVM